MTSHPSGVPEPDSGSPDEASSTRLPVRPYRPQWRFTFLGWFFSFAFVVGAGVGLGWLASWVEQWFYLGLVFPAVMGLAVAVAAVFFLVLFQVRHPLLWLTDRLTGG